MVWQLAHHSSSQGDVRVALVLVGLGFLAETMPYYAEDKGAAGSVAFIPYAAALYCLPDSRSVLFVAAAQIGVQLWHRRSSLKAIFNAAQFTLSMEAALFALQAYGPPRDVMGGASFSNTLVNWAIPALLSFSVLLLTNKACVSAVVAAVSRQPFREVFQNSLNKVLVLGLLQIVFGIYLAWLASALGVFGAAGMVLPILAVRQLARTTIQLTRVTEELLDLMVAAIEARDPYTSGHSKRVAHASVMIAKAMQLKPAEVERVQVAALLHDVGKIHEEFARILAKEGRLTPEEWEIMKRHPVRSAELVGLVTTLKDVVPSVRHHHENWDGTGYPDGIRATSIPLPSRIIMFADTLDAITTDRPYRKALDPEEARSEFLKFRGRQFDPEICDVVVSPSVWPLLYAAAKAPRAAEPRVGIEKKVVTSVA
jgi:putative nucleotidyltransferase with HDIG domain